MDVNGNHDIDTITGTDLVAEGLSWGLNGRRARQAVEETLARLAVALRDDRIAAAHPGVAPAAHADMVERVERLLDGLARSA